MSQPIRATAMKIVVAEETARGWSPHVIGDAKQEKKHGCDILSTPLGGGDPHRVEVKGWGEPFRRPSGKFFYTQDIRDSQMSSARRDKPFRIEIVANLTAYLQDQDPYERLTLRADEIATATPRLWEFALEGKEHEITCSQRPSA